jgi:amidase
MKPPSVDALKRIAVRFGLELTDDDLDTFATFAGSLKASYDRVEELAEERLPVRYPRSSGHAPQTDANPYNAWAWISDIEGAGEGRLHGVRVGIKDNISVAGQPMRNGSRMLDGFVPDIDATVVSRILVAGGIIAGKTTCEDLCFSGGSHTSQPAPVRNPHNPAHAAGGSSSGSAAALAAGDVSMCLGGDQGGSIRTPASWCGVAGLKPTHGLVPFTGIFPIEPSVDHVGPMGRTVEDVARLLDVIAGPDGYDPRQSSGKAEDYAEALSQPLSGLRIGVVNEGFGRPESDQETDAQVRRALRELAAAGAIIEDISIPWHIEGYHISTAIILEGATETMFKGNGMGYGWQGYYDRRLAETWARNWRSQPDKLPELGKLILLVGEYLHETCHGSLYAKAQNLRRELRSAYDRALSSFDVLAMPTTPFPASPLPGPGCGLAERIAMGLSMEGNTAPFDASGHPAMSLPCGLAGGLPIGLMLIGKHFGERAILRAASGFERLGDWRTM